MTGLKHGEFSLEHKQSPLPVDISSAISAKNQIKKEDNIWTEYEELLLMM